MKTLRNIFICSFTLCLSFLHNGFCANIPCLDKIGGDINGFVTPFKNLVNDDKTLTSAAELQQFIDTHSTDFYKLVVDNITKYCADTNNINMNLIADIDEAPIKFTINNQKYELAVNTDKLFMHMQRPVAFLVMKNSNSSYKRPGDVVKKDEIPKNKYFFSEACSDHSVRVNLSNSATINKAGQAAFAAYGGNDNEFFLDMPVGKSCRAFPGLVLGDFGTINAQEKIVYYTNYKEARKAFKTFVSKLHNSACSNQELAVYMVALGDTPEEKSRQSWGWANISPLITIFTPRNLADIKEVTILSDAGIIM